MGGRRFNRCFTGISAGIMALMIAACAETSVGGLPNPSGNAAARSGADSAASAHSIIRLAEASRAAGDRVSAISLYHRAALAAPADAALQIKTGFILHELGAFAEADGAFRRALVVAPRNAEALRGLGITLVARDMPHHAIEQFEAAIAGGGDPRAYNALGVARDMTGDRAAAQQAYAAGLHGDPENLTLLNNLGLSLALSGQFEEAISVLGRVTADANATPRHRQNLALAYGLAGRPDLAADISNNDLAMRDVRNNLGYYAWLRDQPVGENALGATLSAPATVPRAGVMTAEATNRAMAGAMAANNAPPPPLAIAPMVRVEKSAAEEPVAPPLAISPLARLATGAQTADTAESGAQSGEGGTAWELTGIVDDTPAKKEPKTAPAAPATANNAGANAAFEAAGVDEAVSTHRLPDAIAHAIITAPADQPAENIEAAFNGSAYSRRLESAPAENTEAAFDGSAYSRRLESAPEIAFEDAPESDQTTAAADMTATDMTAADWADANRAAAEAESVAAPSAQLAMLPEDAASDFTPDAASDVAPETASDFAPDAASDFTTGAASDFTTGAASGVAPGMIAAAEPASEIDFDTNVDSAAAALGDAVADQSAEVATMITEPERQLPHTHAPLPATGPPSAAQPVPAAAETASRTAADVAAGGAESEPGADAIEHLDNPAETPTETPAELAQTGPEPAGVAHSSDAGPATQSAESGRNGNARATGSDSIGDVATTYPYLEPGREQLAQLPPFATPRMSSLAGGSTDSAAARSGSVAKSGPNVVMLTALGAAMFLIMALLALGRLRQRTGEPEPE